MGEFWENKTKLPIPLGGIVVNRKLPVDIQQKIARVIRRSLEFATNYPRESIKFIKQYAQEINEEVMKQHIDLYVNKYSLELGKTGKKAIENLFEYAVQQNIVPKLNYPIFL